jgi:structural maintenance of chromosome 2
VAKQTEAATALKNSEELLQSLLTGLGNSSGGGGGGYMGQLADARVRAANAAAEEKQNKTKLTMAEKELKELESRWKAVEREAGEGKRNLEKVRKEVEAARKRVQDCGWSSENEQGAEQAARAAKEAEARARTVRVGKLYIRRLLNVSLLCRSVTEARKLYLPYTSITPRRTPAGIGRK